MTRQQSISWLKALALIGVYGGLLMPVVFIPVVIFPFVFSKLIYFQVLIGLTFPAYLILAWIEPKYRPRFHLLYVSIAAYFVALALSVIFSVDPLRSWWGNQERMNGLFTLLHFFAWLSMAVGVLKTWRQWRILLNYEVALSLLMAIVALLQKPFPRLLLFPAGDRVGGLLDNPIYMGAYQIFNLFFLLLLTLKTSSWRVRTWYGVIALFDIGAFIVAESRGDLLGLAAGILAFVGFIAIFSKNKKARYGTLGVLAVLVIAYGILFALRNTDAIKGSPFARLTNFSTTVDTRLIAWKIAWQGFLERPLTGWGLDTFHLLFNQKYNPVSLGFGSYETWFDRSHNTVLDVLSMTGLLGFITFAAIFITLFYSVWRAFRKGWIDLPIAAILFALPIAYFVQNLVVFDHPAAFSMSYLLYGLVIASTRGEFVGVKDEADKMPFPEKKRGASWISFAVLELLALLLVWRTSILPFDASMYSIRANALFSSPQGYDLAVTASKIWTPYLDEQTFLLSKNLITYALQSDLRQRPHWQDYYALAKTLTKKQLADHPLDTHPHFVYAQLASAMMNYLPQEGAIAEAEYRAAIQTSPKRQQLYYGLANLYIRTGHLDEGIALQKQALDFDPSVGEAHWTYGLTLFYEKGDRANGARELAASQTARYPYTLPDIRTVIPLVEAYIQLKDENALQKLVDRLSNIPTSPVADYLQLALRYHQAGNSEGRDKIIAYASQFDPNAKAEFVQLLSSQNH